MKTKLLFAAVVVAFFIVVISRCSTSQANLGDFESLNIDKNMLDSLVWNRLSDYEETSDISYLFGGVRLREAGSSGATSRVAIEKLNNLLEATDSIKAIYDPKLQRLILKPEISCEIESKYLGIYKRNKTTIRGLGVEMLSEKEVAAIKSKLKE